MMMVVGFFLVSRLVVDRAIGDWEKILYERGEEKEFQ